MKTVFSYSQKKLFQELENNDERMLGKLLFKWNNPVTLFVFLTYVEEQSISLNSVL